jgi:hypothetical protein
MTLWRSTGKRQKCRFGAERVNASPSLQSFFLYPHTVDTGVFIRSVLYILFVSYVSYLSNQLHTQTYQLCVVNENVDI